MRRVRPKFKAVSAVWDESEEVIKREKDSKIKGICERNSKQC